MIRLEHLHSSRFHNYRLYSVIIQPFYQDKKWIKQGAKYKESLRNYLYL